MKMRPARFILGEKFNDIYYINTINEAVLTRIDNYRLKYQDIVSVEYVYLSIITNSFH